MGRLSLDYGGALPQSHVVVALADHYHAVTLRRVQVLFEHFRNRERYVFLPDAIDTHRSGVFSAVARVNHHQDIALAFRHADDGGSSLPIGGVEVDDEPVAVRLDGIELEILRIDLLGNVKHDAVASARARRSPDPQDHVTFLVRQCERSVRARVLQIDNDRLRIFQREDLVGDLRAGVENTRVWSGASWVRIPSRSAAFAPVEASSAAANENAGSPRRGTP